MFLLNLHYLDPVDPDLSMLVGFVVRFGRTTFFFGRQCGVRFGVGQDLRLALFSFEPIVLVAQSLDFFGLLGHLDRQVLHQVHQRDEHLAQTFIFNRCGINIFYHAHTLHLPPGFCLGNQRLASAQTPKVIGNVVQ